jgi:hypothetical protein
MRCINKSENVPQARGSARGPRGSAGSPVATRHSGRPRTAGVAGWLLALCVLLLVWQPLSVALVASSALRSLPVYGPLLAVVLLARVLVTGFGIAAGLALIARRSGAVSLAKISLVLSAAMDVFVYTTPFFPDNRPPGVTAVYIASSLLCSGIWLLYLFRSERVARTYEGLY